MTTPPRWFRRVLRPGDEGSDVQTLRRLLGLHPGGFDDLLGGTLKAVLGTAYRNQEFTAANAAAVGPSAQDGHPPSWYVRPLKAGDQGHDVEALNFLLGTGRNRFRYDRDTDRALRRWRSERHRELDGDLTDEEAFLLGNAFYH